MRFSVLGVIITMMMILVVAMGITAVFKKTADSGCANTILVVFKSSNHALLKDALHDEQSEVLSNLRSKGASLLQCCASSSWYLSDIASMFTGKTPTEHGLTRAHSFLSDEAETLAETLRNKGLKTFAAVNRDSLLLTANLLQGVTLVEETDAKQPVNALFQFLKRLPGYRRYFAIVEVDLDVLGGPHLASKVLDILYKGIGGEKYLESSVLAVCAPGAPDATVPFLICGKPLRIGGDKWVIKPVSSCAIHQTLNGAANGLGFNIRDASRTGAMAITETYLPSHKTITSEVIQPPPLFLRSIRFDDNTYILKVKPGQEPWVLHPEGDRIIEDEAVKKELGERYRNYLVNHSPVSDRNIPQAAGDMLTERRALLLGEAWRHERYYGQPFHAVEHVRMAEELILCGYASLALNDLNQALIMAPGFPFAAYLRAKTYATVDPVGALKYYHEFVNQFGNQKDWSKEVEEAKAFILKSRK